MAKNPQQNLIQLTYMDRHVKVIKIIFKRQKQDRAWCVYYPISEYARISVYTCMFNMKKKAHQTKSSGNLRDRTAGEDGFPSPNL